MTRQTTFLVLSLALLFTSCATQVDYVSNSTGNAPRPENCDIDLYLPGTTIDRDYRVIGSLFIGDAGLTIECGQTTVLQQAKAKGCQVGADAILLTEVKEPDWISTCYRLKGSMIVYSKPSSAAQKKLSPSSPGVAPKKPTKVKRKWKKPIE
ncbi:MAG: hypothetical protein CSA34_00615 [Desulfobulbus propionicus]|nr:MAG: hypothetical protein CSA34_00615 [Desulfobulbus propionicus]